MRQKPWPNGSEKLIHLVSHPLNAFPFLQSASVNDALRGFVYIVNNEIDVYRCSHTRLLDAWTLLWTLMGPRPSSALAAKAGWRGPGLANSGASRFRALAGRQGRDCPSNKGVGS